MNYTHTHTHTHTHHIMSPGVSACTSLAVIRARRQRAGVKEQRRDSAAHSRKWKDVTAPLRSVVLRSNEVLIRSNFAVNVCVVVYVHLHERERERERRVQC